jgi:hypothetical protein
MTHTRPSATVDATSWRAVGAGVRGCHAGRGGTVEVVGDGAVAAGAGATVVVVGAAGVAAGGVLSRHAAATRSSRPTSRRAVIGGHARAPWDRTDRRAD